MHPIPFCSTLPSAECHTAMIDGIILSRISEIKLYHPEMVMPPGDLTPSFPMAMIGPFPGKIPSLRAGS
jgi:hypothetical protein